MADALGQKLASRHGELKNLREGYWDDTFQEIADRVIGRRDFLVHDSPGRRRMREIYDTTGRTMVDLLAGGLHSLLTNPATAWFDLRTEEPSLMEDHDVYAWLQAVRRRLLAVFQNPASRFNTQSDEVYLDVVAFGTGTLMVLDEPNQPIQFSARPISEIYLAENAEGAIDTVHRRFEMTARNVVSTFGKEAPEAATRIVDTKPENKITILHALFPSDDPARPQGIRQIPLPVTSAFVSLDDKEIIGQPKGVPEMPAIVARWRVDTKEVYGRGPGHNALADVKMVSEMKKTSLQAGQMAVAPPFLTEDDGSIVQLDMRPFGRNIVKPAGLLNPPIQPLDINPKTNIGIELIRDTRQQVEEAFHFELLKLIQNRGLTPMSATQSRLIQNSVERLLAPILGRFHEDYLGKMIDRVYGIELRRGNLPPVPPALSNQPLQIEYLSPITRAQRRGDVDATLEFLNGILSYAGVDPSVLDLVDADEAWRYVAVQGDIPAEVLRSPRAIRTLREAQRQQAAEEEQKQNLERLAKGMGAAAPMVSATSQNGGG